MIMVAGVVPGVVDGLLRTVFHVMYTVFHVVLNFRELFARTMFSLFPLFLCLVRQIVHLVLPVVILLRRIVFVIAHNKYFLN